MTRQWIVLTWTDAGELVVSLTSETEASGALGVRPETPAPEALGSWLVCHNVVQELRAKIEAIHPDGEPCVCVAAVLAILDEESPVADVVHWDSNAAPVCPVCHKRIIKDAHGGPHPSAGDHDPAYHVAANYGTWHESLGPRP